MSEQITIIINNMVYLNRDLKDLEGEEWKTVIGFERYAVSSLGRVKSYLGLEVKLLKQSPNNRGYLEVRLYKANKKNESRLNYPMLVHRIVGMHFIDNPNNFPEINHKSGIKTDNIKDNLEWMTSRDNQRHAFKLGLQKAKKGDKNILSKPILCKHGSLVKYFGSITLASIEIGVSRSCIRRSIIAGAAIGKGQYKNYQFVFK